MEVDPKAARRQRDVIAALLTETTIAGVLTTTRLTLGRLLTLAGKPEFEKQFGATMHLQQMHNYARLVAVSKKAVDRLEKNLDGKSESSSTRAAQAVLQQVHKGFELHDLAKLVKQIEGDLARNKP